MRDFKETKEKIMSITFNDIENYLKGRMVVPYPKKWTSNNPFIYDEFSKFFIGERGIWEKTTPVLPIILKEFNNVTITNKMLKRFEQAMCADECAKRGNNHTLKLFVSFFLRYIAFCGTSYIVDSFRIRRVGYPNAYHHDMSTRLKDVICRKQELERELAKVTKEYQNLEYHENMRKTLYK